MNSEPKTDVLLRMMEQPERYTEEQWRDILSDSECRELYTLMAMTGGSLDAAKADAALMEEDIAAEWERVKGMTNDESRYAQSAESESPSNHEGNSYSSFVTRHSSFVTRHSSLVTRHSSFKKIAAIFLAAAFLSGLTFAAYRAIYPRSSSLQSPQVTAPSLTGRAGGESTRGRGLLSFSNLSLDSILTVVAAHYDREVWFRDTSAQALRLSTVWDADDSLSAFIAILNEFDGLRLTDERDTLFVESVGEEEE